MRRCAAAVAVSIVGTAAIVAAAGPGSPLSPGLQAGVAALGIDAELVPPRHPADICQPPAGGQRGMLAADFDGNGRVDWALLLQARIVKERRDVGGGHVQEIRDGWIVVVLGDGRGGGRAILLRAGTVGDDHLALQPPGVVTEFSGEDGSVQRRVRLRHPGFVVVTCEKGATTWFWDTKAQAFRSLTTGD